MKCDEHKTTITFTLPSLCETMKTNSFLPLGISYLYDSVGIFPVGISKHPVVMH
jgi:hypothetical protein